MNRLFQILLLFSLIAFFWLFAIGEMEETKLPKKSFEADSTVQTITSAEFLPKPNLDYDFRWQNLVISQSKSTFKGFSKKYTDKNENILCFRGNHFRDAPTRGNLQRKPKSVTLDWIFKTRKDTSNTQHERWGGGTGWTGQALLIRWSEEMKKQLGIRDQKFLSNSKAREVIVGSLSGHVYYLNFETGDTTRTPTLLDGPIKGTVSADPRLNGLLYVGQGISTGRRFGSYIIDMTKNEVIRHQSGRDPDADRSWGAFDSNPLIDKNSGTVFWPSENGIIYSFKSKSRNEVKLESKLKYSKNVMMRYGLEASMAATGRFGFFADNSGNVFCMDLVDKTPVWNQNNYDDTDASLVLEQTTNDLFLYTGNEVDFRAPEAVSIFRKLNARNGKEIWRVSRNCRGTKIADRTNSGGILATPLLGKKNCKDMAYVIFSRMNEKNQSELVAVNRKTGKEVFSFMMKAYSWASPIDLYDTRGNMYIFFTDVRGHIYLINGKNGELIYSEKTNYTFESSPIAFDNRIVVGVRGNKILSFLVD